MEAERWLATPVSERKQLLRTTPFVDPQFLDIVRAPDGWGVFASAGPNFRHAIFGRDSIETAADLCAYDKQLAHDIILTLARLQGVAFNAKSEEEPGKIHHEFRARNFADVEISRQSLDIMRHLQNVWGAASDDTMLYYGSYDATPLYVRLVERYCKQYGPDILEETYTDRKGETKTIRQSVLLAAAWITDKVSQRPDHLLAYRRINPQGLENQAWKDSHTSYLFMDGSMPNLDAGVVSVELQGYAYDALKFAATLAEYRSEEFAVMAGNIRNNTITKLWMPNERFFAQGLAVDHNGQERQIDALTSNAGLLLDSNLLTDLPEDEMRYYTEGIVATIMGPEFRTEAGLRCRAARHADIPGYPDYHGSYAVWPKETFDIAEGLERLGFQEHATKLYENIVQAVQKSGEFYEFYYVEIDGTVWYDAAQAMQYFAQKSGGNHLPTPEPGQAWTIAAAIASSYKLANRAVSAPAEPLPPAEEQTPVV